MQPKGASFDQKLRLPRRAFQQALGTEGELSESERERLFDRGRASGISISGEADSLQPEDPLHKPPKALPTERQRRSRSLLPRRDRALRDRSILDTVMHRHYNTVNVINDS